MFHFNVEQLMNEENVPCLLGSLALPQAAIECGVARMLICFEVAHHLTSADCSLHPRLVRLWNVRKQNFIRESGTMTTTDEFLLVKETAELLGVSANTVRAWALSGKLQEYRHPVNNYRLFKRDEVEALLGQITNPEPVNQRIQKAK